MILSQIANEAASVSAEDKPDFDLSPFINFAKKIFNADTGSIAVQRKTYAYDTRYYFGDCDARTPLCETSKGFGIGLAAGYSWMVMNDYTRLNKDGKHPKYEFESPIFAAVHIYDWIKTHAEPEHQQQLGIYLDELMVDVSNPKPSLTADHGQAPKVT